MTELFTIQASIRTSQGRGPNRRLRQQNFVPGIVYGRDRTSTAIVLEHKTLQKALENEAFFSHIITLRLEGQEKTEKVVLKEIQRHPYRPKILHVDFQQISETEKLHMNVPIHIMGEGKAPGIQLEGGILTRQMNEIEILCLPADLPSYIEVDITALHLNQSLHLSQLSMPKGVESIALSHGDNRSVVSIQKPKEEVEEVKVVAEAEVPEAGTVPASAQKAPEAGAEAEVKKGGKEEKNRG
ncbi:MAG: 50S ribosomal protein L25/general stress protein Ctc [Gammaproteobacteria bacterium]|nr:50S ribosomal protein L25/general stress protein Ctc [Gammaproteobacteria bacterium]